LFGSDRAYVQRETDKNVRIFPDVPVDDDDDDDNNNNHLIVRGVRMHRKRKQQIVIKTKNAQYVRANENERIY